jgi:hypothetical protein
MLRHTFCHIPGIGLKREERLHSYGIHTWEDLLSLNRWPDPDDSFLSRLDIPRVQDFLQLSIHEMEGYNVNFFHRLLPLSEHWRLFPHFRDTSCYLDIETTGLGREDSITTISLYDGESVRCYIRNKNMELFERDIMRHDVLITYNGRIFDIPFIQKNLGITLQQAQIDLRYPLADLGFRGGLKGCERSLGIDRGDLTGVDGYMAVLLWKDYMRTGDERVLETLLAYNIEDTVNLETLMIHAYNLKIGQTQVDIRRLPLPNPVSSPFRGDPKIIDRILNKNVKAVQNGTLHHRNLYNPQKKS